MSDLAQADTPGNPTAAEPLAAPAASPALPAGTEAGSAAPAAENHQPPTTQPPAGESAAAVDVDALLAGMDSVDAFRNLALHLPTPEKKTDPFVEAQAEGRPASDVVDPATDPEEPANVKDGAPLPKRLRIANLPEERQKLIMELARNPDAKLEDLMRPPAPAAEQAGAHTPLVPPTIQERAVPIAGMDPASLIPPERSAEIVQAELDALYDQQAAANERADLDQVGKLIREIGKRHAELPRALAADRAYERNWRRAVHASEQQAIATYDGIMDGASPINQEMKRLHAVNESVHSQAVHDVEYPMNLAARAAANLGIAPRAKAAPTAAASAPAPVVPVVPPVSPKASPVSVPTPRALVPTAQSPVPAPGGARTAAPSAAAVQAQTDQVIGSMKDVNDVVNLLRGL